MSGFDDHYIDHLSCSSLATAVNALDVWGADKLFDKKRPFGPAGTRGNMVEEAVVNVLGHGVDIDTAVEDVLKKYDKKFMFDPSPDVEKQRNGIPKMVAQAVEALEQYGKPDILPGTNKWGEPNQHPANSIMDCGDFQIPFEGFMDLVYPQHGLIVDLKTTFAIKKKMPWEHVQQRCYYAKCNGNQQVKFLYVSPAKFQWSEDGDVEEEIAKMKTRVRRLEAFLSLGDKEMLRGIIPVQPDTFYWNGAEDIRKELYGI